MTEFGKKEVSFKDLILREVVIKHPNRTNLEDVTSGVVVKLQPPLAYVVVNKGKAGFQTIFVPYSCIIEVGNKVEDTLQELLTSSEGRLRKIGLEIYKQLNSQSVK